MEDEMDEERQMDQESDEERQMEDAMDEECPDILDIFKDLGLYLKYDNLVIKIPPLDTASEPKKSLRQKLEWIHLLNIPSFIPRYNMVMARPHTEADIRAWFYDLMRHGVPMFLHEHVFYSNVLRSMIERGIDYRGDIVDLMEDKEASVELGEMFPAYRMHIENGSVEPEARGCCTFSRTWVYYNNKAFKVIAQDYDHVVNRAEHLTKHDWLEECLDARIEDAIPKLLFPRNKHDSTVTFAGLLTLLGYARRRGYQDSEPSWRHRIPYCEAQIREAVDEDPDFEEEPRKLNPHWLLEEIRMGALPVDLLPTVWEANAPLDYEQIARMQVRATGRL